jgi:surfactin synthase thioesterase subunit
MKLICLPYPGAGAGVYRPWLRERSDIMQAVPLQFPGREDMFAAPFYGSLSEAVSDLATRICEIARDDPFFIFGHCISAVLAYEIAVALSGNGGPAPEHIIVSGSPSPRRRRPISVSTASDEQVIKEFVEQLGQDGSVLRDPELRELLLPIMRADARLLSGYEPGQPKILPVPITSLRGSSDAAVTSEDCADWAKYTSRSFEAFEMDGGRMYLTHSWPELWARLEKTIQHAAV